MTKTPDVNVNSTFLHATPSPYSSFESPLLSHSPPNSVSQIFGTPNSVLQKCCVPRGFGVPCFGTPHLGQKLCLTLPFRVPGEPKRHGRAENTQARPPRGKAPGTPPQTRTAPETATRPGPEGRPRAPPRTGGHGAGPVSPRRGHLCVDTGGGTPRRPGGGHGGGGGDGELALGQLFNGISERVALCMDLVSWDE